VDGLKALDPNRPIREADIRSSPLDGVAGPLPLFYFKPVRRHSGAA
jgi:hypothetical protein